jgi:hypothetical protein
MSGPVLAFDFGHNVICVDKDVEKIPALDPGEGHAGNRLISIVSANSATRPRFRHPGQQEWQSRLK